MHRKKVVAVPVTTPLEAPVEEAPAAPVEDAAPAAPAPKKRGRPRKVPEPELSTFTDAAPPEEKELAEAAPEEPEAAPAAAEVPEPEAAPPAVVEPDAAPTPQEEVPDDEPPAAAPAAAPAPAPTPAPTPKKRGRPPKAVTFTAPAQQTMVIPDELIEREIKRRMENARNERVRRREERLVALTVDAF